jgi:hypothetical protein
MKRLTALAAAEITDEVELRGMKLGEDSESETIR